MNDSSSHDSSEPRVSTTPALSLALSQLEGARSDLRETTALLHDAQIRFADTERAERREDSPKAPLVEAPKPREDSKKFGTISLTSLPRVVAGKDGDIDGKVAICLRVKNEAPHLAEWLMFHLAAGVTKVIVMDDASTDAVRETLLPFQRRFPGYLEYVEYNITLGATNKVNKTT